MILLIRVCWHLVIAILLRKWKRKKWPNVFLGWNLPKRKLQQDVVLDPSQKLPALDLIIPGGTRICITEIFHCFKQCERILYIGLMNYYIFTARNEVGARLCFHRRVWFCSQRGGVCLSACWDTPLLPEQTSPWADSRQPPLQSMLGDTVNARAVRILLECNLVLHRIPYFAIWKVFLHWHK